MTASSNLASSGAVNFLTRTHPQERRRNIWAQMEAKAERSSNLIRIGYVTGLGDRHRLAHAPGNPFWSNFANLGVGGFWLVWSIGYQAYLLKLPYQTSSSTCPPPWTWWSSRPCSYFYSYTAGPAYALKVPTFLNYFCCLGLAAMRYRLHLALYGGIMAAACYLGLCALFPTCAYDIRLRHRRASMPPGR